jgi:hypothetical protein
MKTAGSEELRIVFSMATKVAAKTKLGDRTFDVITGEKLNALSAFQTINRILEQLGKPAEFRSYEGASISKKSLEKQLQRNGKGIRYVQVDGLVLQVGNVTARGQSFISIEEKSEGAAISWESWVSPFLEWPNFVQAWVTDAEYNFWQNAEDPIEYKGIRDMTRLKMKSNGSPYPLEKQIVDISQNPGRWEFHQGYIEAIGPIMWIGENLWRTIGHDGKDALAKLPWLHMTTPRKGILQLSSDVYFHDETTASEQNALRTAIYGS